MLFKSVIIFGAAVVAAEPWEVVGAFNIKKSDDSGAFNIKKSLDWLNEKEAEGDREVNKWHDSMGGAQVGMAPEVDAEGADVDAAKHYMAWRAWRNAIQLAIKEVSGNGNKRALCDWLREKKAWAAKEAAKKDKNHMGYNYYMRAVQMMIEKFGC